MFALVPAVVSCGGGDDYDEPDGPGATPGGINNGTSETQGLYLTSINDLDISYDSKGRVIGFSGNYYDESVTIDYSKGKIFITSYDDEDETMDVKFNDKGYISSFSQKWEYSEDGEYWKGSGSASASYDKAGHITKITSKSNESYRDEEESGSYSGEETWTFNWSNGNLTSVVLKYSENEDGDKYNGTEKYILSYGTEENTFKQVSFHVYEYVLDSDVWAVFGCAGLMGVGTDLLPEEMVWSEQYNDEDGYSETEYFTFTKNNNGTLHSERMGYNSVTYGYENLGVRSASEGKVLNLKKQNIFRTHKDRKARKVRK